MTRRDRYLRNAHDKLVIAERYAKEARHAIAEAEREPVTKPVRVSEADVLEARRLMRIEA